MPIHFCLVWISLSALSGCASAPHDEASQNEQNLRAQLDQSRQTVVALSAKLDRLEGQVKSLSESLAAAQKSAGVSGVGITPGATSGVRVSPRVASTDPSAAFVEDEAVQHFRRAMVLFTAGNYADAIVSFASFLENYPDHPLAGSAQYYVGKSYLSQKAYKEAISEFQRELTSYDRSPHIADCLAGLIAAEDALNRTEDANRYRQLLSSLFPQSSASSAATSPPAPSAQTAPSEETPQTASTPAAAPTGPADLDQPPPASSGDSLPPPAPQRGAVAPPTPPTAPEKPSVTSPVTSTNLDSPPEVAPEKMPTEKTPPENTPQ